MDIPIHSQVEAFSQIGNKRELISYQRRDQNFTYQDGFVIAAVNNSQTVIISNSLDAYSNVERPVY